MIYMCDIKLDVIFIFSTADELGVWQIVLG